MHFGLPREGETETGGGLDTADKPGNNKLSLLWLIHSGVTLWVAVILVDPYFKHSDTFNQNRRGYDPLSSQYYTCFGQPNVGWVGFTDVVTVKDAEYICGYLSPGGGGGGRNMYTFHADGSIGGSDEYRTTAAFAEPSS